MSETEVEILRKKVAAQVATLVRIERAKVLRKSHDEAVRRQQASVFKALYDAGGIHRERLFQAILTPEERAVAKAMRESGSRRRELRLPWLHKGARIL